ncbi:MAG: GGDEF domain-containing protein [Candidatus Gastranaerophilales bacterium]|nr:GGDEF domain-containing protein [Candidatus Gastranaerophilales bacterium]
MTQQYKNMDFLNKLSGILTKKISPARTISQISKLFKTYLKIEKAEFILFDNNNVIIKDFITDWDYLNDETQTAGINSTYSNLTLSQGVKFYFNETEFDNDFEEKELYRIEELTSETNNIIFPLALNGEVIGFLKAETNNINFDKSFFLILNVAAKLISGAFINYILNEQMEVSLNFYKAMKDIAKIIESQYELSYIIPIIGEMIDRFMSSHLIYIFIKKDDKYELVWPNLCKDTRVYKLLEKISAKTEYLISENGRTGVFPLSGEEGILGAIAASSNVDKLNQKDIDYLIQLTRQSGLTIHRANVYAEVLKYATLDALTGLNNRRQFEMRLKQEVSNSKRHDIPLCCIMLDVDYFKKVNDTYGHAAGDCVLKEVSEIIKNEIREYDIACRYGGEEFFIILPRTKLREASTVGQRLRKVMEESKMDIRPAKVKGTPYINITISIGVCAYDKTMSAEEFILKADKALYEAKETGRNRVIVV